LEIINETAVIYFHCAQQGMKLDLLEKNPHVCVEGDIFINVEKTAHGITARSESVIGFGKCCFINERDEILHGLKLLTEHYGYADYPLDRCAGLQHLLVGKIVLEEITGKKNLPGTMTPADKAATDRN
jgi:nitroimidazol reductase NimA-like FMN-containing flavoprotein (pyridoxamine 5'-phosphate oxidase superfamily)